MKTNNTKNNVKDIYECINNWDIKKEIKNKFDIEIGVSYYDGLPTNLKDADELDESEVFSDDEYLSVHDDANL